MVDLGNGSRSPGTRMSMGRADQCLLVVQSSTVQIDADFFIIAWRRRCTGIGDGFLTLWQPIYLHAS